MSARDALAAIAEGRATPALLHTCRLEGFGVELYGRDAILNLFRRRPARAGALFAETERLAFMSLEDGAALIADLNEGHVARLWRLGPGPLELETSSGVDIPRDPHLSQFARAPLFEPRDHPELTAAHAGLVARFLQDQMQGAELEAARMVALRAASAGPAIIVLARLEGETGGGRRLPQAFTIAALMDLADAAPRLIVTDEAGHAAARARAWTPRL